MGYRASGPKYAASLSRITPLRSAGSRAPQARAGAPPTKASRHGDDPSSAHWSKVTEIGPSLRWARAEVERIERDG